MRGYIVGSYGFDNTGDEAILASLVALLREHIPDLQLTVMSGNPDLTAAQHHVEAVHWQSIAGQFDAVAAADFILVGGGGLFFDYWGFYPETIWTPGHGSLSYVGGAPLLAALLGKPVVYYAVGAGPLRTGEGRRMTRALLEGASSISVREQPSQDLIAQLGIPRERVHVSADPAFALAGDWTIGRPKRDQPMIGIALRPWEIDVEAARWEAAVADGLDRYLDRHEAHLKFIPFQWIEHQPLENDYAVAQRVVQAMRHRESVEIAAPQLAPRYRARMLSECDMVVGMRLHAAIFATMAGAPFVALTYDPKVLHLAAGVGCEQFVLDLHGLAPDALAAALEQAWEQREIIAPRLQQHTSRMAELARRDAARLAGEIRAGLSPISPNAEALRTVFTALQGRLRQEGSATAVRDLEQRLGGARAEVVSLQKTLEETRKQLDERDRKLAALEEQLASATQAERIAQSTQGAAAKARRYRSAAGLAEAWWSLKQGNVQEGWTRWRSAAQPPESPASAPPSSTSKRAVTEPSTGSRGTVHVLTPLFFDREGQTMMSGGAERYLIELAPILRSFGFHIRAYQSARGAWTRDYNGIEVCGLDTQGLDSRLNEVFHTQAPPAALTLYHAYYLAAPLANPHSIGISHGINWDSAPVQAAGFANLMEHYRVSIANLEHIVSVDTNTINWARATHHHLSHRFRYIPNFVDIAGFQPRPPSSGKAVHVLYPRRLTTNRGFWLAMEVIPQLMAEFPEMSMHFVGLAESAREQSAVETLRDSFPSRVTWRVLAPERMPEAYAGADIAIVPTTASEGTSLSCLEAMASGNAVIATNVGGLPDLVQDGYNGLLIEPESKPLGAALEKLIRQSRLRKELAARGVEVARTFQLPIWRERWRAFLVEHLAGRS
ncbi:MAG: polysaccharide pyruvyl transferase family protein [Bryobacterales bacterium]|nr:polysaccharide pyruvyl transferase family protein [Bryobacterales bacterium]